MTPPLVVEIKRPGGKAYAWIQNGRGWLWNDEARRWEPFKESQGARGICGVSLSRSRIDALIETHGLPDGRLLS